MRFVCKLSFGHAALLVTETFLTGSFCRRHRWLRVFGAVFSLVVLNSFSGVFTSFLAAPKRGPEIETLKEADAAYRRIYARGHIQGTFKSFMGSQDDLLRIGAKLSGGTFDWDLIEELKAGTSAFMDTDIAFEGLIREVFPQFLTAGKKLPLLRKIPECVFSPGYVSFPVRKDWKYTGRYDALLQRLVASGIIDKITQDGLKNTTMKQTEFLNYANDAYKFSVEKLTLDHFREAFLILGIGLSLATISFVIEAYTN
ncbi:Protein of unknown function [Gryllus bimaculatus]|nr:Protein of unknown function [Gryllus bimaculatus]